MDQILREKYEKLIAIIKEYKHVAVAFSGGVDSTLLLKVAVNTLGKENVIAITASSGSFPQREFKEAKDFCEELGVKQIVSHTSELDIPGFLENPPDRCYLCKKEIFTGIIHHASEEDFHLILEGSNMDDNDDYRPGMRAIKELGVKSPLQEAELFKSEIRALSKMLALPTWEKPSFACLATRFVYGEPITSEKLAMVEKGEELLFDLGFKQVRVRIHESHHGNIARIEVFPEEIEKIAAKDIRETIAKTFKDIGFAYTSLDLTGYRTGSMNEVL
ncbi:MAG: ATP-dependent sacrificial sulfur transferase LarE [Lachnospiraceae bacterium]|nr:ATP-dependent sacrificial sulfur transferase LarE [Lachnospiraceae bacterium]